MMRIGQLARLAGMSVRTLRHYEAMDLLHPVFVDPRTGYRHYEAAQVTLLHRIGALRDLDLPICEIRAILGDGREAAVRRLLAHRGRLQDQIEQDRARMRQLQAVLQQIQRGRAEATLAPVRVRALPAVNALCRRSRLPGLGAPVAGLFESAERDASAWRVDASPFLLFHDGAFGRGAIDVEACVPVKHGARLRGVRVVEAVQAAGCAAYQGPYRQSAPLYRQMRAWIEHAGASSAGPLREVYHRFGANQDGYRLPKGRLAADPMQFLTELQVPIAPAGQGGRG